MLMRDITSNDSVFTTPALCHQGAAETLRTLASMEGMIT
jgi:hypothetical protein